MKKLLIAVAAIAAMTASARASALDFDFSITNTLGYNAGTVTGEIIGLSNNATSSATAVIITNYPMGTGLTDPSPLPFTIPAGDVVSNTFTVSNGVIDALDFNAHVVGAGDVITWELLLENVPAQYLLENAGGAYAVEDTAITFTPVSATTPLPPAAPLFATILGLLGCVGYWRKRRTGFDFKDARQFA